MENEESAFHQRPQCLAEQISFDPPHVHLSRCAQLDSENFRGEDRWLLNISGRERGQLPSLESSSYLDSIPNGKPAMNSRVAIVLLLSATMICAQWSEWAAVRLGRGYVLKLFLPYYLR